MNERKWKDLDDAARKWLHGWIAVMDKDLNQKIIHHDQLDDSMLFYYPLPQFLTKEQFEKTNVPKEIKVALGKHDFPTSNKSTQFPE